MIQDESLYTFFRKKNSHKTVEQEYNKKFAKAIPFRLQLHKYYASYNAKKYVLKPKNHTYTYNIGDYVNTFKSNVEISSPAWKFTRNAYIFF